MYIDFLGCIDQCTPTSNYLPHSSCARKFWHFWMVSLDNLCCLLFHINAEWGVKAKNKNVGYVPCTELFMRRIQLFVDDFSTLMKFVEILQKTISCQMTDWHESSCSDLDKTLHTLLALLTHEQFFKRAYGFLAWTSKIILSGKPLFVRKSCMKTKCREITVQWKKYTMVQKKFP